LRNKLNNPSSHLSQLQRIDSRIDAISARTIVLEKQMTSNPLVANAQSNLAIIQKELSSFQAYYNDLEEKSNSKKLKIEQSQSSLYSGTIKNPKELQDLQTEITSLKTSLSILEDEQLSALIQIEEIQKKEAEASKELQNEISKNTIDNGHMVAEISAFAIELERIKSEKDAIIEQISKTYYDHYCDLRKLKKGLAVSVIEECSCSICGSSLTPAECQLAKSAQQIAHCPSCGRILFAG
jgi:uncharacterized protein